MNGSGEKKEELSPPGRSTDDRGNQDNALRFMLLQKLVAPHVRSFDYFIDALQETVENLTPLVLDAKKGVHPSLHLNIRSVSVGKPLDAKGLEMMPFRCRQSLMSYAAPMKAIIEYKCGSGGAMNEFQISLGDMPIMVGSNRCHLKGLSADMLPYVHEEPTEQGGYFIVNGAERIMRLLIQPRRNHIVGLIRPSFTNRGPHFSHFATQMRCVKREGQTSHTVTAHYLKNGSCKIRLIIKRQEFFIPATMLIFALRETTAKEVYLGIVGNKTKTGREKGSVESMLRQHRFKTRDDVLSYLGSVFRSIFSELPQSTTNKQIAHHLLDHQLFVHISSKDSNRNTSKFHLLLLIIKKLYSLAKGDIKPENADALSAHEVLLPGHLVLMVVREKLQDLIFGVKDNLERDMRMKRIESLHREEYIKKLVNAKANRVGDRVKYLISTGNLQSNTGLDLMQTTGFTIVGDKLNYFRYLSHFRSVHRGQFFTEMKTTAVRKLLPESWGFLCPVHTPDGSPCGLLNHLAAMCQIVTHTPEFDQAPFLRYLRDQGMLPIQKASRLGAEYVVVCLDGVLVGYLEIKNVDHIEQCIRKLKIERDELIPFHLEAVIIKDLSDRVFPGIYLATTPARFIRPIYNLKISTSKGGSSSSSSHPTPHDDDDDDDDDDMEQDIDDNRVNWETYYNQREREDFASDVLLPPKAAIEWVGPMEQCFMAIACTEEDFQDGGSFSHQEINPAYMLSLVASLTPFSDFNQSPRNMYQCQMGKQSMGHPLHSFPDRSDNTLYRLQTPQRPIVRNKNLTLYGMDEYPIGCNAVVAVLAYTGYDMEDAMIINKSAYERGFGHGSVYKFKTVDITDHFDRGEESYHHFGNCFPTMNKTNNQKRGGKRKLVESLDLDGLPKVGMTVKPGEPLACIIDNLRKRKIIVKLKGVTEKCIVQEVRVLLRNRRNNVSKIGVKLLLNRNPVIGDKFSSRHGQKGVMSRLFPATDMPFSESGMQPDIIINPHAFPSRMTIGMLIESIAGKAGAMHGIDQDATPFQFSESDRAVDYFGEQLAAAGYNYMGNETLYSGFTGEPFTAEIFIGVVYYQRLRHMVSDKSQVRSTGPVNKITRQPIKGRKVHGGIRFGEMERDSLLAHGSSYLLYDRLVEGSDYANCHVCGDCGSILGISKVASAPEMGGNLESSVIKCRQCGSTNCHKIVMPYVFTYLAAELGAMNIKLCINVT
eukprot:jgi/Bigna1/86206/estExt_fgenesh1_pg.C_80315